MLNISNQELQHKMVVIRAEVKDPPSNTKKTEEWFFSFIKDLGMEVLLGPHVVYHPEIGNRGLTGIAGIKTSSITLHCWDEPDPAILMLDVYTCSSLDLEVVWKSLEIFSPIRLSYKYIDRDKDLVDIESKSMVDFISLHPLEKIAI